MAVITIGTQVFSAGNEAICAFQDLVTMTAAESSTDKYLQMYLLTQTKHMIITL